MIGPETSNQYHLDQPSATAAWPSYFFFLATSERKKYYDFDLHPEPLGRAMRTKINT